MSVITINREYAKMVPDLEPDQYQGLKQSIHENGQKIPIIVNQNFVILDGHHRYEICKELGIEVKHIVNSFDSQTEELVFVGETNLQRRHLTLVQRIMLAEKLRPYYSKLAQERIKQGKSIDAKEYDETGPTRNLLAKKAHTSHYTYDKAITVLEGEDQKLKDSVISGKKSIDAAFKQINMKRRNLIPSRLPEGVYDLIYLDPPWDNRGVSVRGAPNHHYNTMDIQNIQDIELPMAHNCIVFLWTLAALQEEAFEVLKSWGLEYKTQMVWDKEIQGVGFWTRTQHEILFIATRGEVPAPDPSVVKPSVYREKRPSVHSQKPEYFRKLIESYYPKRKKLEMFARAKADGWTTWGNEIAN